MIPIWTRAGRRGRVGVAGLAADSAAAADGCHCRTSTRCPEGCSREGNIEGSCREGVVNISRCLFGVGKEFFGFLAGTMNTGQHRTNRFSVAISRDFAI